jgi:hypothetical protein
MIDLIIPFLVYGTPIVGITYVLYKYSLKQKLIWKDQSKEIAVRKSSFKKMIFSTLAFSTGIVLIISWVCVFWIPSIEIPRIIILILLITMGSFSICLAVLVGLTSAVESGASSVTNIINKTRGKISERPMLIKGRKGRWERKPDIEANEISKHLKKSSYDPTLPIGTLIISFLALYGILGDKPNALTSIIIFSLIVSFFTFVAQRIKGRSLVKSPNFKICNKCFKEDTLGLKECNCGGVFEPPGLYIFIEEKDVERKGHP